MNACPIRLPYVAYLKKVEGESSRTSDSVWYVCWEHFS